MRPVRPGPKTGDQIVPVRCSGGMLAAALLCLLLPAALHAQTGDVVEQRGTPLAVCDDGSPGDNRFDPCDAYIDGNIKDHSDTIKWILGDISGWKAYSQHTSSDHYARSEVVQWIIVLLSFLTTIAAAVTKLYPKLSVRGLDFAIAPIILSAMIAAVTSINAFYQFDESRRLSQNMADDLEELETEIHFRILRHVANGPQQEIDEATIIDWHERLETIMQRYSQRETGGGL